jgi:hypothetical protein
MGGDGREAALVKRPPSGCEHCGLGERGHCQQWTPAAGWHGYEPPTKATIRQRLRARYADRIGSQP